MRSLFLVKGTHAEDFALTSHYLYDLFCIYRYHANNEVAYYNLLFSIAISAAPLNVLELGTGPGLSSLAFIRTLQYYNRLRKQKGTLHTCDLNPATLEPLRYFKDIVQTHCMSTDDLAIRWEERKIPIDLIYIDADHSHEQSLKDFNNFIPYLNPNGLVLMHDTFPLSQEYEQPNLSGTVYKTAQYIKKHYSDDFEIMTVPYLCGISLLRKKGAKYF